LPVVLLCAIAAPAFSQSDGRQALADAIYAANAQLDVEVGRNQVRAHQLSPEVFRQREAETAAQVSRLRSRWSGTLQRWTFDNAYDRALKDPVYRYQALSDYDRSPAWLQFPASLAGSDVALFIVEGLFVLLVIVIIWAVIHLFNRPKPAPQPVKPDTTYGSADWAEPTPATPDAEHIFNGVFFGKASVPELADVPLEEQLGAPVCSEKKRHTLICAQPRTGKGTRIMLPTLLRYQGGDPGRPSGGSVFCIDPKGENFCVSARARRALPSDVHIINPWGEFASLQKHYGFAQATYNPLDILDPNDPNVVSTAQAISAVICPPEPGGKNPFWNSNAANILTAVLLWLTDQPNEKKTLGRAREILTRPKKDFQANYLSHMVASTKVFGGAISEHAAPFDGMAQETYSGIMSNVQQYTTFLSDQAVKATTAASTFSMRDLLTKPTTVYLVIPPDKLTVQRTWLRLLIMAALHTYKHHGSSNVNRCLFAIDELPALGLIELDTATMAGYGVDYVLIVQSLDQLRVVYGDAGYGAIMSNCAYKWFCNVSDLHTAEYLSKTLGNKTVDTSSGSTSTNLSPGGGSTGTSTSHGKTGRPLLMPNEIMNLGRDAAVLLAPNSKPRFLRTVDYWDLTKAFPDVKQYKVPPLTWDKNPMPH